MSLRICAPAQEPGRNTGKSTKATKSPISSVADPLETLSGLERDGAAYCATVVMEKGYAPVAMAPLAVRVPVTASMVYIETLLLP
jgi:hypothetical protein